MFFILVDILLLVIRSLIAVGINRLKLRHKALIKFNVTKLKDVKTNIVTSAFSDEERTNLIEQVEQDLIYDEEANLKSLAEYKGLGFARNSEPYSSNKEGNEGGLTDLIKEEGENFVIGEATNLAVMVGTTVGAGGAGAVAEGIVLSKDAVIDEYEKIKEEDQEAKEAYVRSQRGRVLMLSNSAKERIYNEAIARVRVKEAQLVRELNKDLEEQYATAGGPNWRAKAKALQSAIRVSKVMLYIVDTSFVILTSILALMAMFMLIMSLIIGGVTGYLVLDSQDDKKDETTSSQPNTDTNDNKGKENNNTDNAPKGNGDAPAGIDPKSWGTASEWGQKIAEKAHDAAIMKVNGRHLTYRQGNTPVGVYDCSVFVTGVYESFGKLTTGKDRDKGRGMYDFNKDKKSDLQAYMATAGMRAFYPRHPEMKVATLFQGDWESKIQPGDVLLVSGHVAIYIGKNTSGTHMMAHAASPSAYTYYSADMKKSGTQVGLAPITNLKTRSGATTIYRPHVNFK